MRYLLALTLTLLLVSAASAQLLMYEGFNYDAGQQLPGKVNPSNSNTWNQPSAPAPTPAQSLIVDDNLSYSGLSASTGKTFALPRTSNGNTTRINLTTAPFPGTAAADIYFSFLMRVDDILPTTDAIASNATHQLGEFFAGLTASTTGAMSVGNVYAGMVRIRREVDGSNVQTGNYQLGLHKNNASGGNSAIQWATSNSLQQDTTVLVVGEYSINPATTNDDIVRLWINPTPGAAAGTPTLQVSDGVDVSTTAVPPAQSAVGALWFRDGAGTIAAGTGVRLGPMTIDEVRIGTTFASVTPAAATVLVGDYNNDGVVNAGDYAVWRKASEGGGTLQNETASIGTVDSLDYAAWRGNFGAPTPGLGSSVSVPEPAGLLIMAIGLGTAWLGKRRSR